MSESTPEERTEMPTERRMGQLRKEGALFVSQDMVQLASLLTGIYMVLWCWSWLYEDLHVTMSKAFTMIGNGEELTVPSLYAGFMSLSLMVAPDLLLIAGAVAVVATFAVMLQTNWNFKERGIKFDLPILNPLNGIKRIFSIQGVVTTLKALLKLSIILPIAFFVLKAYAPQMVALMHLSVEQVMVFTSDRIVNLFWQIFYVLLVFAIFDYSWGKFQWLKRNKMTKAEVKDERKSIEGDEETKRKIQAKAFQRVVQRLKSTVPKAHVVITNPTHISVALRYDRANDPAPVVVAKGKGFIALRIRELAKEHRIPVVERKPVARALFESAEVGSVIPRELFRAVAEVLAYVYRLKNPYWQRSQQANS